MSGQNGIYLNTRRLHKSNIKIEREKIKGSFINDQGKLSAMKFGISDISYAGCELIAIYNSIKMKTGKTPLLSNIILGCEVYGYTLGSGKLGTNVYSIGSLLSKCGISYKQLRSENKLKSKRNSVYIISYWNNKKVTGGIHTIAVQVKKKNRIRVLNKGKKTYYGKFSQILEKKPYIIGYKIKGVKK